jgi:hypothetical protein
MFHKLLIYCTTEVEDIRKAVKDASTVEDGSKLLRVLEICEGDNKSVKSVRELLKMLESR